MTARLKRGATVLRLLMVERSHSSRWPLYSSFQSLFRYSSRIDAALEIVFLEVIERIGVDPRGNHHCRSNARRRQEVTGGIGNQIGDSGELLHVGQERPGIQSLLRQSSGIRADHVGKECKLCCGRSSGRETLRSAWTDRRRPPRRALRQAPADRSNSSITM